MSILIFFFFFEYFSLTFLNPILQLVCVLPMVRSTMLTLHSVRSFTSAPMAFLLRRVVLLAQSGLGVTRHVTGHIMFSVSKVVIDLFKICFIDFLKE